MTYWGYQSYTSQTEERLSKSETLTLFQLQILQIPSQKLDKEAHEQDWTQYHKSDLEWPKTKTIVHKSLAQTKGSRRIIQNTADISRTKTKLFNWKIDLHILNPMRHNTKFTVTKSYKNKTKY